jgi:PAS domain S-box-containing protein
MFRTRQERMTPRLAVQAGTPERRWFWATLTLSSFSIVVLVFAAWEVIENRLFSHVDYVTLHYLYITRGILTSLLLAFWAAWYVLRQRRQGEEALRRSHARYRGLLEVSPGAVALYDADLRATEWNATAQRLYGWNRDEILGNVLPTVPPEREGELRMLMQQVAAGSPVLNMETLRCDRNGHLVDVQLSLLPFQEASGQRYFFEVTEDIRERVRMRAKMLEIEKLASMGKMAAGTAHHLNTPLAAMLLRVEMMREQYGAGPHEGDLERLEEGIRFCQQFVRRLLDFSRRPPAQRQPEELAQTIRSVVSFLAPALQSKCAVILLELSAIEGQLVLADRNLLEVLFSTILSNALDAIPAQGRIEIACSRPAGDAIEVRVTDNGCGIQPADQAFVFEPFFTTKGPGKGTGLGLAIAQNIVFEHGGSIRLESRPGGGTTVLLRLPACQPSPVPQEVPA